MAEKITVKAEKREQSGKGFARRLRAAGKVPVTVYGGGKEAASIAANLSDLAAILRSDTGHNTIFTLDVEGEGTGDVIFQDRQIDALKGRLLHADLRRLAKGEKIEVTVSIHFIGEPVGVKQGGGVLEQVMREVKIVCEPSNIPEFYEVNVEHLDVGDSVHVSDLKADSKVEILEDEESVVATVTIVKEEVEAVAEEGETGAEAEAGKDESKES